MVFGIRSQYAIPIIHDLLGLDAIVDCVDILFDLS